MNIRLNPKKVVPIDSDSLPDSDEKKKIREQLQQSLSPSSPPKSQEQSGFGSYKTAAKPARRDVGFFNPTTTYPNSVSNDDADAPDPNARALPPSPKAGK